ncbi:GTP cyclohydrolase II [Nocardia sp. 2]|uniref:GTP cyclohydrolase II n=1 Tax=Nocardia acididurans TaxID=2802282 RepID=A0ABS1M9X0_9NOCA|nr:GTP cyclohydrolase II [Nocardia acididurans]
MLADTTHVFTRRRRDIRLSVVEVGNNQGHALVFGDIGNDCLVRVHSRCLYGDALRSDDCDCGPELDASLDMIQAAGRGVLLYLEQEGRGAGLVGKARGYRVSQLEHLDTFSSYRKLGFSPDSRTYGEAARTLSALGLTSIRLLTNNPDKVGALESEGLRVQSVPLHILPPNRSVERYLAAKRQQRGHSLPENWRVHRLRYALAMATFAVIVIAMITGLSACAIDLANPGPPDTSVSGHAELLSTASGQTDTDINMVGAQFTWSPQKTRVLSPANSHASVDDGRTTVLVAIAAAAAAIGLAAGYCGSRASRRVLTRIRLLRSNSLL